jgi:hypothetical protein
MESDVSRFLKAISLAVAVAAVGTGTWWGVEAMVIARTVNEGRTVADMAENVGRWASQYGGVHVRTEGASAPIPGTFLTRSVYARTGNEASVLQGARAEDRHKEREVLQSLEAYHWKNPALVQRELSDVLLSTGSRAQYRLTARTVLNPNNEPNKFELEALTSMQRLALSGGQSNEYWKVEGGRLLYARAVVAQKSCLKCHDSQAKAPEFLRVNERFNGGGGFGYQTGKPAGVISVAVPLPETSSLLTNGLPGKAWGALAIALLAVLTWIGLSMRGVRRRDAEAAFAHGTGSASVPPSSGAPNQPPLS